MERNTQKVIRIEHLAQRLSTRSLRVCAASKVATGGLNGARGLGEAGAQGPGLLVIPLIYVLGGVPVRKGTATTFRTRKWRLWWGVSFRATYRCHLVLGMHFRNFSKGPAPQAHLWGPTV